MKSKAQVLWIDDYPQRKKRAEDLEDESGMEVKFLSIKNKNLESELKENIPKSYHPDLIIIDHILDMTNSKSNFRLGSSYAGILRETWGKCPIFGITAADKADQIDIERYAYDELIKGDQFTDYLKYIPNVVTGFKECTQIKSIDKWIDMLGSPEEDKERIKACMPHNAKTDINKKGFANRVYRWFRYKFYAMPGFLYDEAWVATFTGIDSKAINKYIKKNEKSFEKARYTGIYNDPDHPRWWKTKLYQIIYGKCKDENAALRSTQDVANEVLNVKEIDESKCFVCKNKWPETVAYVDKTDTASKKQMHLSCTITHPLYKYVPMFEEIRMMKGK